MPSFVAQSTFKMFDNTGAQSWWHPQASLLCTCLTSRDITHNTTSHVINIKAMLKRHSLVPPVYATCQYIDTCQTQNSGACTLLASAMLGNCYVLAF